MPAAQTVLHAAVTGKNAAVIPVLVEAGVDPAGRDNDGRTALHAAASSGWATVAMIEAVITAGTDLEARDNWGRTALHHAVMNPNDGIASALLAGGADPGPRDNDGLTALHLAARSKDARLILKLMEAGGDRRAHDKQRSYAIAHRRRVQPGRGGHQGHGR